MPTPERRPEPSRGAAPKKPSLSSRLAKGRSAPHLILLGVTALIGAFFLAPVVFSDEYFWGSGTDIRSYHYPHRAFAFSWLRRGVWPLWNPYIFNGIPFQTGVHALGYPGTILGLVLSTGAEIKATLYVHVVLAMFFMALLLRGFGRSMLASVLGAVIYGMSGFSVAHAFAGHLDILMTFAYVPLFAHASEIALRRRGIGWTLIASAALGLMVSSGHFQIVYLGLFGVGLFMLGRALLGSSVVIQPLALADPMLREERYRQNAGQDTEARALVADGRVPLFDRAVEGVRLGIRFAVIGAVAALLVAFQLLPTMEATELANRSAESSYEFASSFSVPLSNWATYLAPDLFGGTADVPFFAKWSAWEGQGYLGIAPLFLLALAVAATPWRRWAPAAIVIAAATALAMGEHAPFFEFYYGFDPLLGRFRVPPRFVLVVTLFSAWAAAYALDHWRQAELSDEERRRAVWGIGLALAGLALFVFMARDTTPGGWLGEWIGEVGSDRKIRALGARGSPAVLAGFMQSQLTWALGLGVASAVALVVGLFRQRARMELGVALVALCIIDLQAHAQPKLVTRAAEAFGLPERAAKHLVELDEGHQRMITHPRLGALNAGAERGLSHVGGYDILIDERYNHAVNLASGYPEDRQLMKMTLFGDGPFWQNQGVRYLAVGDAFAGALNPRFSRFGSPVSVGGVTIYESDDAAARASVVRSVEVVTQAADARRRVTSPGTRVDEVVLWDEGAYGKVPEALVPFLGQSPERASERVDIERLEPNDVEMVVDLASPGVVVLTDAPFPGWAAALDGKPTNLYAVNGDLHRAVAVPAGKHRVHLSYLPDSLRTGLAVSAISWTSLIALLVWGSRRSRARDTEAQPHSGAAA